MSTKANAKPAAPVTKSSASAKAKPIVIPEKYAHKPEESIWHEYSPHQEAPLSFGASLIAHVFVILVVGVLAGSSMLPMFNDTKESPKVDNVIHIGGGGGGAGDGGGDPLAPKDKKEPGVVDKYKETSSGLSVKPEDISKLSPEELKRLIESEKKVDKMFGLAEAAKRAGEAGQGGSGTGGGKGTGIGKGTGPGIGDGVTDPDVLKELDRWILSITYSPGRDYLNKLAALDCVVVVDMGEGKHRVYRDLLAAKPEFTTETDQQLKQSIAGRLPFYIDDERNVGGLAELLEFAKPIPKEVMVAMSYKSSLRDELKKKEKEFKGKTDKQIEDEKLVTHFDLNRNGERWDIKVRRQYPKRD